MQTRILVCVLSAVLASVLGVSASAQAPQNAPMSVAQVEKLRAMALSGPQGRDTMFKPPFGAIFGIAGSGQEVKLRTVSWTEPKDRPEPGALFQFYVLNDRAGYIMAHQGSGGRRACMLASDLKVVKCVTFELKDGTAADIREYLAADAERLVQPDLTVWAYVIEYATRAK